MLIYRLLCSKASAAFAHIWFCKECCMRSGNETASFAHIWLCKECCMKSGNETTSFPNLIFRPLTILLQFQNVKTVIFVTAMV